MFRRSGLLSWRNMLRLGLLATGVYLWKGGRLGPPRCRFYEVSREKTTDGILEVNVAACGTPTAASMRRQVERFAHRYEDAPGLRIHILHGGREEIQRAVRDRDAEYLLRHNMATYERSESEELFIDSHRVREGNRVPAISECG